MALQVYQCACHVQSVPAENWLGVTVSPGAGIGDGVGVGLGVGVALGVALAVGVAFGEDCGDGEAGGMGDGTGEDAAEEAPEGVCGVTRAVVLGKRIDGKAKEERPRSMATITIDEIVIATHRYLDPCWPFRRPLLILPLVMGGPACMALALVTSSVREFTATTSGSVACSWLACGR